MAKLWTVLQVSIDKIKVYKPWLAKPSNAWNNGDECDSTFITR